MNTMKWFNFVSLCHYAVYFGTGWHMCLYGEIEICLNIWNIIERHYSHLIVLKKTNQWSSRKVVIWHWTAFVKFDAYFDKDSLFLYAEHFDWLLGR